MKGEHKSGCVEETDNQSFNYSDAKDKESDRDVRWELWFVHGKDKGKLNHTMHVFMKVLCHI